MTLSTHDPTVTQLNAYILELEAQIGALTAALEPFAVQGDRWGDRIGDGYTAFVEVGMLRAARRTLGLPKKRARKGKECQQSALR